MSSTRMTSQEQIQTHLANIQKEIDALNELAIAAGIERVEFLGGYLHFGTSWENCWGRDHAVYLYGKGFRPAAGGPVFNQEYWSASSFVCWPSKEQRKWMFGPDEESWPATFYSDESYYESGQWKRDSDK